MSKGQVLDMRFWVGANRQRLRQRSKEHYEDERSKPADSLNSSSLETATRRFENEPNSNPEAGEYVNKRIGAK